MSSTPPRASSQAIFSDSLSRVTSSPPSSPPPPINNNASKPPTGPFKNVFSILGKRKPLTTASEHARPTKTSKVAKDDLQQMQISLGQKVNKRCDICGMEYVASSAEDRKLHDKYHKQNVDGFDLGKDWVAKVRRDGRRLAVFKGVSEGDAIVYLDCWDNHHRRKKGQAVLEIVQRELGAVEIPEADIWDMKSEGNDIIGAESRYKSYLYVRGTKCVGFLLTKRIEEALEVVKPKKVEDEKSGTPKSATGGTKKMTALEKLKARKQQEQDAAKAIEDQMAEAARHPLQFSETKHAAVLGISRIWTSSSHRGLGIAQCLLNTAINRHNSSVRSGEQQEEKYIAEHGSLPKYLAPEFKRRKIERKQDVAFSQPTEAGAKLARKWFGRAYGWRVYID